MYKWAFESRATISIFCNLLNRWCFSNFQMIQNNYFWKWVFSAFLLSCMYYVFSVSLFYHFQLHIPTFNLCIFSISKWECRNSEIKTDDTIENSMRISKNESKEKQCTTLTLYISINFDIYIYIVVVGTHINLVATFQMPAVVSSSILYFSLVSLLSLYFGCAMKRNAMYDNANNSSF